MRKTVATKIISDFVETTEFDDLPGKVVEKTKICLLDSLGCAIGAYKTQLGKVIVETAKQWDSRKGRSTLMGDWSKVGYVTAAFVNSALANALDFDDTFKGIGHPGCTVIPPALAVAEAIHASGKELITSTVLGYEALIRIGEAILPSELSRRLNHWIGGSFQTFGTTACIAKLLNLSSEQIVQAFGIAGTTAPVPSDMGWGVRPASWTKGCYGWSSLTGTIAAFLARKGFLGRNMVLDGSDGFWTKVGSDRNDTQTMIHELGSRYRILDISFKPYSSCRRTHSSLDALRCIMSRYPFRVDEVSQVIIRQTNVEHFRDYNPRAIVDAQFSLPYVAAMTLLGYEPGPEWFTEKNIGSPEVSKLMKKVSIETDPEADRMLAEQHKMPSTVEVVLRNGGRFKESVEYPRGDPLNPLTDQEVKDKFTYLASSCLSDERVRRLLDLTTHFEKLDDVSIVFSDSTQ